MSLAFILCSALVASPTFSAVTAAWLRLESSVERLMGISSILGIQIMMNWPGFASEHSLSLNVNDLIVGVSRVTLVILTVRNLLAVV